MRRRLWVLIALVAAVAGIVVAAVVIGGNDDNGRTTVSRPLTSEEANRLGVTRFRNHEAVAREVTLTIPAETGALSFKGSVDFRRHVGYGVLSDEGSGAVSLVQWTLTSVIALPWQTDQPAPTTPPAETAGWQGRALSTDGSSVDTALLIALNLAGDRPENAQLLNQNGALWLRSTTLDGQEVDVVRGPGAEADGEVQESRTRFWLTADGTSLRVEVALATADDPVVVGLGDEVTPPRAVKGLLEHDAPGSAAPPAAVS